MPFHMADEKNVVKQISKQFKGGQTLSLSYRPHYFSSREQAAFEDDLNLVAKVCPNQECGAKLPLEELSETERTQLEMAKKKLGVHTNGHIMYERTLICDKCNTKVQPGLRQVELLSDWLSKVLSDADWDDDDGPIPIEQEAIATRVLPDVLMFAFQMIGEDKAGKGSRAR